MQPQRAEQQKGARSRASSAGGSLSSVDYPAGELSSSQGLAGGYQTSSGGPHHWNRALSLPGGPSLGGGAAAGHTKHLSAPSPLRYNSPTKKVGYTRWPPLISPTLEAVDMHFDDDYAEVRLEMERVGHNLTSVMMNPREEISDMETAAALDPPSAVVPVVLPPVDLTDVLKLQRRTANALEKYRQHHHAQSQPSPKSFRSELELSKSGEGAMDLAECFRQVPGIFFSRDFQLTDPALFEALVVNATPETQERFSQYLDVVETCLLRQISSRSQHFFEALTTLQDVRERVAQACGQVMRLRRGLHDMDRKTVMGMISIPRLAQRKVNLSSLIEKLRLMQEVHKSKELVQSLLSAGDYMAALDLLEDARALMRDGLKNIQCMKKLERQLAEYLDLVADLMGTSFINLAVKIEEDDLDLLGGLEERPRGLNQQVAAELTPRVRGLVRLCRLSKVLERYRTRMVDTLKVVVKTVMLEYLDIADYSFGYPDEDDDAGATGGQQPLTPSLNGGQEAGELTARVRAMEPAAFLEALQLCFEQLLIPMEQVALVHGFLEEQMSIELTSLLERRGKPLVEGVDDDDEGSGPSQAVESSPGGAAQAAAPSHSSPSGKFKAFLDRRRIEGRAPIGGKAVKDDDQIKVLELEACKRLNDEILRGLCDLCQRRISSLLVIRKEVHVRLQLTEMKPLWDATIQFVGAMERISGTSAYGLKSTLLTQAKLFLEHVHETNMASLVSVLDSERWSQADVSAERQAELDRLTGGKAALAQASPPATDGPPLGARRFSASGRMASDGDESMAAAAGAGGAGEPFNGATTKKKKEPVEAVVEDTRYKVVWSVLLLVSMLMSYLNIAANFPNLAVDVVNRVVDILRLFNTRTTQLVLGAGAIHAAARLRSISAKHLALASQCLSLVMVLTPHARAALSTHLTTKQQAFLVELDRVKQEYMEHHEKILAKFVGIIGDMVASSAATSLKDTEWDNMASAPCRFIEDTIKGITTLHKVLHQHLPPAQVQDVFSRIFDLLTHRLREYFEDIKPTTTAGRQRLVDEISHLVTSLSMLRGVNAEALRLDDQFRHRYSVV